MQAERWKVGFRLWFDCELLGRWGLEWEDLWKKEELYMPLGGCEREIIAEVLILVRTWAFRVVSNLDAVLYYL